MRIGRSIRQVHRLCGFADHADQALAFLKPGLVDSIGAQALGGKQLQHLAGTAQIDGADLRHHIGGDDADQLVQPHLGGGLLRHDLAQAAQKQAWSATRRHQINPVESSLL